MVEPGLGRNPSDRLPLQRQHSHRSKADDEDADDQHGKPAAATATVSGRVGNSTDPVCARLFGQEIRV